MKTANNMQRYTKSGELENRTTINRLNCVDLFAGAGGFSLAAKNVGLSIVAAVEWNPKACETYRHNLIGGKEHTLYEKNILKLNPLSLIKKHFSDGNDCDILLGGPPCQGFSVHRINGAGVGDPRNELLLRYFEFVKKLKPKIFLMENVPGLLWKRHQEFLEDFYKQGRKAKYRVYEPEVIDAQHYGVPQRRKRVFILGVRNDVDLKINWPPKPTHGGAEDREEHQSLKPLVTASSVFSKRVLESDENNIHMNHGSELIKVFKDTPINGGSRKDSGRILPCHQHHNGHKDVYGRVDPKKPGPTMTTACINPSKGRFVHPTEHHGITLRHAARFQTFPDDFVFRGGLIAGGEQIGNAVPVKLGEILLATIADSLNKWSRGNG